VGVAVRVAGGTVRVGVGTVGVAVGGVPVTVTVGVGGQGAHCSTSV